MKDKKEHPLLTEFRFGKEPEKIIFQETVHVVDGVECDVYSVEDDDSKDLGIIRIGIGGKTPLQKVLKGERTVEGHVSGKGKLTITKVDGKQEIHPVDKNTKGHFSIDVGIGETMQWEADKGSELIAFEICIPPYKDGRYKNL